MEINKIIMEREQTQKNNIGKNFESIFLTEMLSHLFNNSTAKNLGQNIHQYFFIQECSKKIAENGSIGIAKIVDDYINKVTENGY